MNGSKSDQRRSNGYAGIHGSRHERFALSEIADCTGLAACQRPYSPPFDRLIATPFVASRIVIRDVFEVYDEASGRARIPFLDESPSRKYRMNHIDDCCSSAANTPSTWTVAFSLD